MATIDDRVAILENRMSKLPHLFERTKAEFRVPNLYSGDIVAGTQKIKPSEVIGLQEGSNLFNFFSSSGITSHILRRNISFVEAEGKYYVPSYEFKRVLERPGKYGSHKFEDIEEKYGFSVELLEQLNGIAYNVGKNLPDPGRKIKSIRAKDFFDFYVMVFNAKYGKPGPIPKEKWGSYTLNGKPFLEALGNKTRPAVISGTIGTLADPNESAQKKSLSSGLLTKLEKGMEFANYLASLPETNYTCIQFKSAYGTTIFFGIRNVNTSEAREMVVQAADALRKKYHGAKFIDCERDSKYIGCMHSKDSAAMGRFLTAYKIRVHLSNNDLANTKPDSGASPLREVIEYFSFDATKREREKAKMSLPALLELV